MPDKRGASGHILDGVDAVASTLYIVLLAIVVGGVLGAAYYLVRNGPAGLGSQGELVYLGIGVLLVIGWTMSQLTWLIKRRRRDSWTFADGSELPLPTIDVKDTGLTVQWGQPPASDGKASKRTWTWSTALSNIPVRSFALDAAALDSARAARAAGAGWDDVCRRINPEWEGLPALERALFQRALEAALGATAGMPASNEPRS